MLGRYLGYQYPRYIKYRYIPGIYQTPNWIPGILPMWGPLAPGTSPSPIQASAIELWLDTHHAALARQVCCHAAPIKPGREATKCMCLFVVSWGLEFCPSWWAGGQGWQCTWYMYPVYQILVYTRYIPTQELDTRYIATHIGNASA